MKTKQDVILRGLIWNGEVSLAVADTTRLVGRAIEIHGLSPLSAAALGRTLTVAAYMCSSLKEERGGALCFVGDGINDAPVLMRSDIGIAMGGVGSDAAIEASDIVLMQDDLRGLPLAKRIAKKTMAIVFENIVFSLAVKAIILILSAVGIANMWLAVFGDVGVAVLAILNAMRVNSDYGSKGKKKAAVREVPAA